MSEIRIDPTKYAGLTQEEKVRKIAEDERRAISDHPGLQVRLREMENSKAMEEAEELISLEHQQVERDRRFAADLENHRRDREAFYRRKGVPDDVFEAELWPEIRRKFVAGEKDSVERERQERASSPY